MHLSLSLVDIVLFGFSKVFKTRLLGGGFYDVKKSSFSSPTEVGSHNLLFFEARHPR